MLLTRNAGKRRAEKYVHTVYKYVRILCVHCLKICATMLPEVILKFVLSILDKA